MHTSSVILGEVVTEKAIRMKAKKSFLVRVHPDATKIDVKNALRTHYGVDASSVRMMKIGPKYRVIGRGTTATKRSAQKRAIVTLSPKSKPLDLSAFQS